MARLDLKHPDLAVSFPAHLTHRSGIDKRLFAFMSTCFSSGMGPKQFSDVLRVQHKEAFHYQQLQYLQGIYQRAAICSMSGVKFIPFGSFDGEYAGFVPSATWLRDIWDDIVESQAPVVEQYMSMLPVRVIGMDHAHKVKHCNIIHSTETDDVTEGSWVDC